MAVLAECPICHKKQSTKNRLCACGENLVNAKKSKRVRYWITYRLPSGNQRKEFIGFSADEARAAEGKRKAQKVENPSVLEKVPDEKMTFQELADWYLGLLTVKRLKSFERIEDCLNNFLSVYGGLIVARIKPLDLEGYQAQRESEGAALATIDMELSIVKTMINKALDNDLVGGNTVKTFRRVKKRLRRGSNARDRILAPGEYQKLVEAAPDHLKGILVVAYNTGMRRGEILGLKWSHVDFQKGFIRLPADMTKENKQKSIPINRYVLSILKEKHRLRAIHHEAVFTYRGKPIAMGLRKSLQAACKAAGIPYGMNEAGGLRFHDIRATVKTNMLRAGVDKVFRDLILGHSIQGIDSYYLKPSEEDLIQAMARYTDWLDGQHLGNTWATNAG
jgi:integrase